jgi:ABC-type transport system substrate-binding protein
MNVVDGYPATWPNWFAYSVYQPLVNVNESAEFGKGTIQFLPGLASNWTVSSDGMTYTFNLRQNVHFSNGDPLNAYQVWTEFYGYYYLAANSSTFLESYNLFDMSQVRFGPSTIALLNQSGLINPNQVALAVMTNGSWPIHTTSAGQIVFHLKTPFIWFLGNMIAWDGLVFDEQWVFQHGGLGKPGSPNTYFNQHSIPGTGPYVVSGYAENAFVKFAQNPNYWGSNLTAVQVRANPLLDPGHAKNVLINFKPDDVVRYTDLSTDVAQISAVQTPNWSLVLSNPEYHYLKVPPWNGIVALMPFNMHLYPTNITAVRQAIVHAINYTDIAQKAYLGQLYPMVGPEYPGWKDFYDLGNLQPYQYNVTMAQQILARAQIDTSKLPPLQFVIYSSCSACTNAAQVIQSDLGNIGLQVNIVIQQQSVFFSGYGSYATNLQNSASLGNMIIDSGWAPNALTPADNWLSFVSNGSLFGNWGAYYNPLVQKCVDSFTSTTDITSIQTLCTAAQKQIYDDAPVAWLGGYGLFEPSGGSLVWKRGVVKGFLVDPVWSGQSTSPILNTVTFGS